jgi:Uma2 family endonuclease
MIAPAARPVSYAEYLAAEARSESKHEFHDGTVVAMAGGSPEHSLLCARLLLALGNALEGSDCRPFESNLRLCLASVRRGLYRMRRWCAVASSATQWIPTVRPIPR